MKITRRSLFAVITGILAAVGFKPSALKASSRSGYKVRKITSSWGDMVAEESDMDRKIHGWFSNAIKDYDGKLRVRWCPSLGEYAIEREAHGTPSETIDGLKAVFHARSQRKIREGTSLEVQRKTLRRRKEAKERLDALNRHNHRILFFIPDLKNGTLQDTLYTLQQTDLWNYYGPMRGDVNKHTDMISREIDYYDNDVDERARNKFQDDRIHRAKHLYDHLRYRDGSRISMVGAS